MAEAMTAERWRKVTEMFDAVIDLPTAERTAALAKLCGTETALRAEVQALLDASDNVGRFMEEPARDSVASMLGAAAAELDEPMPERIGLFRIEREIGRGGMGTVYLAERDDDQFRHRVALKLARSAFADSHMARRFLDELMSLVPQGFPAVGAGAH